MKASIYLADEGYIAFESGQTFFKFLVPKKLTAIKKVISYDNGYVVIDTNYGDEYIDLKAVADEIQLDYNFMDVHPIIRRV